MRIGQTVNRTLTSASGRAASCGGCYADLYEFTLTSPPPPGADVAILLESNSFDGYLRLLDSAGHAIASDDNSGLGTNALIRYFTGPGTYRIEASSRAPGAGGAYTLTLRLSQPFWGSINVGQTQTGTLTVWSGLSSYCNGCFGDLWDFSVGSSQTLTINMTSVGFSAFVKIWLWDGIQFRLVAQGGAGTTARISQAFQSGSYRMEATSSSPGVGSYSLSVAGGAPSLSGRWETHFDVTFSNCVIAPGYCVHCLYDHAYSVSQTGSLLQGTSADTQPAQISGAIAGNSVTLLLKESFPGGCSRSFDLAGSAVNSNISGTVAGRDDNCGTCRINGTFQTAVK
jgi:hypothetical protein